MLADEDDGGPGGKEVTDGASGSTAAAIAAALAAVSTARSRPNLARSRTPRHEAAMVVAARSPWSATRREVAQRLQGRATAANITRGSAWKCTDLCCRVVTARVGALILRVINGGEDQSMPGSEVNPAQEKMISYYLLQQRVGACLDYVKRAESKEKNVCAP